MFQRKLSKTLAGRLIEPRRFIQIVVGPRQTGKTTAVKQAVAQNDLPRRIANADEQATLAGSWIEIEWQQARRLTAQGKPALLVIDEIQKVAQWSQTVKRLWDEDSWNDTPLSVVLSGSSSLLIQKGLSESLAGRFEVLRSTHWLLSEMSEAFDYGMEDYLHFGGYPGAAAFKSDPERWITYMRDSIIEATVSKDVLQMEDVRKPALLRNLFMLGAQYSAQEISYRKLLGQLDDKGNAATMAHYLELLSGAGLMAGLKKYDPKSLAVRSSSPRLLVRDPSLMTATWGGSMDAFFGNPSLRGHLVETAVGVNLLARAQTERFEVHWWRDGGAEVDFVVTKDDQLVAIEVKSGRIKGTKGLTEFCSRFPNAKPLVIGDRNTSIEDFLRGSVPLFD
ncbi:ATP-binding protein [Gordonibacter sp.]|uniref:ATP-binding protein n=3 Tax=Gordonibacter sp. TaxID=1968902 RepID=UPI002FC99E0B